MSSLRLLLPALLLLARPVAAAEVVVLTSYPEPVVSRFEAAFEKAHPDIDLKVLWRMPHDALPYLTGEGRGAVDVYWSPAPSNFIALRDGGALADLSADADGLPRTLGGQWIADPGGRFVAGETAGYGLLTNPARLHQAGVEEPRRWSDLAKAQYAGLVALPIPSKVGFMPPLVDHLLQTYGWAPGWALLAEIAGNSRLVERSGPFVTDVVADGDAGVGVVMDFFAAAAIAAGQPLRFAYPPGTAYSPAQIGILAAAPHPAEAHAFTRFILSAAGQRLLFDPKIRKLPIRPEVYADAPAGYHNPFLAGGGDPPRFDGNLALARRGLDTALFDAAVTRRGAALRAMWEAIHRAERQAVDHPAAAEPASRARLFATAVPVTPEGALDLGLLRLFADRDTVAEAARRAGEIERQWDAFFAFNHGQALALAHQALATAEGKQP